MPNKTMNSLQKTDTKRHFQRLIFGGVVALLPALMAAKGCDVAQIGSDNRACGGLEGLSCESGEFCNYSEDDSCGAADATGVCAPIPELCGEIYAPVCGCDDETYDNACSASRAGVSVASEGECGAPSNGCGPMGEECDEGEFCKVPISASCAANDDDGVCTPKPEECTLEDQPVCGCDGETYDNTCHAYAAGVSVASAGECGAPSNLCGGDEGAECGEDEFCNYSPEAICGNSGAEGTCEPIPPGCDENYDPVCGCDGATHSSACAANLEGIAVASEGECEAPPDVCGGDGGAECGDGEFCNYPLDAICGNADATGVCEPIPELCGEIYAPVCGCDGATHSNACMANLEGISVAFEGECDAPSEACGGDEGAECGEGEFCKYSISASCGATGETGECTPTPEECTLEDMPVCGCDGETYDNTCHAYVAGVSVSSEGECGAPSDVCGGLLGEQCGEGEFCSYPPDAMCGAADATGVCEPAPDACDAVLYPVCGCDGTTYDNECEANVAGVAMAHAGECDGEVKVCGGDQPDGGGSCGEGEFCNYDSDAYCGFADATGVCEPIPEGCTTEYDPVCGCNGEIFTNECEAHAAGVAVNSTADTCAE